MCDSKWWREQNSTEEPDWERDLECKLICGPHRDLVAIDPLAETEQEVATRLAEESVGYCE